MLNNATFYHSTIRNTIIAFGSLFSDIKIQRKNKETGLIEQTIAVPIAYSQKEKWVHSIEANPDHERGIYTALPRLGFEITGYSYDSSRKLARMNTIHCMDANGRKQVFTPVPYNVDIALYFATKTQEDGLQILEQILPTFSPEYTMTIKAIPTMNINQDVPYILNGVSVDDQYEGDLETRRFVIHTLTFTAKINLYGGVSNVGLIKQVEADVFVNPELTVKLTDFTATQATPTSPIIENLLENF